MYRVETRMLPPPLRAPACPRVVKRLSRDVGVPVRTQAQPWTKPANSPALMAPSGIVARVRLHPSAYRDPKADHGDEEHGKDDVSGHSPTPPLRRVPVQGRTPR